MMKKTIALLGLLLSVNAWASAIQQQGIKTAAQCTAAGASLANCLPLDSQIYVTANGLNTQLSTAITSGLIGGSGGAKNYLSTYTASLSGGTVNTGNGNFENGTTTGFGLVTVGMTGVLPTGTPSAGASQYTSFSATTGSPLSGKYSLSLASTGTLPAGVGFMSSAFYIDQSDQGKVLSITGSYNVQSGASILNFSGTSSNTYAIYIYDVTNAAWIQPAGVYSMTQNTGVGKFSATFQTTSNSTQYRLAILTINATGGATGLYFDDLSVGPQVSPMAPAISDWKPYTPTLTGFGTATGVSFYSRRVGDSLEIQGQFVNGTTTSSTASFTLGYNGANGNVSVDTTKVNSQSIVGHANIAQASTTFFGADILTQSSNQSVLTFGIQGSTVTSAVSSTGTATLVTGGTNVQYALYAKVPIVGWSSNSVASSDTATQVISATVGLTNSYSYTSGNAVIYDTVVSDKSGMYSSSNGRMTVPASGSYAISVMMESSNGPAVYLAVNGVNKTYLVSCATVAKICNGSTILPLNAGDYVTVQGDASGTLNGSSVFQNSFSIQRISGPAVITATESVNARYTFIGNGSLPNSTSENLSSTYATWTKVRDTHSAFNTSTGIYTVPVSGMYHVCLREGIQPTTSNAGLVEAGIQQGGSSTLVSYNNSNIAGISSGTTISQVCDSFPALAGDTFTMQGYQSNGSSIAISSTTGVNSFSIERVGN